MPEKLSTWYREFLDTLRYIEEVQQDDRVNYWFSGERRNPLQSYEALLKTAEEQFALLLSSMHISGVFGIQHEQEWRAMTNHRQQLDRLNKGYFEDDRQAYFETLQ
jgi:hypothetical protein